jgi:hypothetical protein
MNIEEKQIGLWFKNGQGRFEDKKRHFKKD